MKKLLKLCMVSMLTFTMVACGGGEKDPDEVKKILEDNDYKIMFNNTFYMDSFQDEDGTCYSILGDEEECSRDRGDYSSNWIRVMSKDLLITMSSSEESTGYVSFRDNDKNQYTLTLKDDSEKAIIGDEECAYYFEGKPEKGEKECKDNKDDAEKIKDSVVEELDKYDLTVDEIKNFLISYNKDVVQKDKEKKQKAYKDKDYSFEDYYDIISENYLIKTSTNGFSISSNLSYKDGESMSVYVDEGKITGYSYINIDVSEEMFYMYPLITKAGLGVTFDKTCKYNLKTDKSEAGFVCNSTQISDIKSLEIYCEMMILDMGLSEKEFLQFLNGYE